MLSWPSSTIMPSCPRTVCLPQSRLELGIKTGCSVKQKIYIWIIRVDFFFSPHKSSKGLEMVVTEALINWVEMCWRATGDTGTVVKLGQCQTLQPWLSLLLRENSILSYINPISLFICTLRPFISLSARRFPFAPSLPSIAALFTSVIFIMTRRKAAV